MDAPSSRDQQVGSLSLQLLKEAAIARPANSHCLDHFSSAHICSTIWDIRSGKQKFSFSVVNLFSGHHDRSALEIPASLEQS
jgi:hypothetical protein